MGYASIGNIMDACDVIVDFTSIESTKMNLKSASAQEKAMVMQAAK